MAKPRWDGIIIGSPSLNPAQPGAFLPLDHFFVCPECSSNAVLAKEPKTITDLGGQHKVWIPRQQDRWCLHCGHKWTATLAPEVIASTP